MKEIMVNMKRLNPYAKVPVYSSDGAAAFDLYAAIEEPITIHPGEEKEITFGLALELPAGYKIDLRSRSGLWRNYHISAYFGLIDSDYRGELSVLLTNNGKEDFIVKRHDRIAQGEIQTYTKAIFAVGETLSETARGEAGFGSTGV